MNKHLLAAVFGSSLAISGCQQKTDCYLKGGEYVGLRNSAQVASLCQTYRNLFFKCVKIDDAINGDATLINVNCSDDNYQEQIADTFSNSDLTICNGAKNPESIQAVCQEID